MTERTIRLTAKDLCAAYYEEWHSDRFRQLWPNVGNFVARNWPTWVPVARARLTHMLSLKDSEVSPQVKEAIYKALIEDREREASGPSAKVGYGPLMLRPDEPGTREKAIFYNK